MEDANSLVLALIAGLFGTGGIATIAGMFLSHKAKMVELNIQSKQKDIERLAAETEKATAESGKHKAEEDLFRVIRHKEIPLEHHPVFATLDEIEHYFLKNFELEDLGRTIAIREFVVNKIRAWRTILKKYANEGQACYVSCNSAKMDTCNKSTNIFRKMLMEGIEKYEQVWETTNKLDVFSHHQYDNESLETMKIFIPIFQEWHASREETVRLASNEIPNAGLNITCHGDWWDILYVYLFAFVQMKYDAPVAMKALNGELTGKKIFGIVIGDLH